MGGEEAAAMFPKERPDLVAIGLWQGQFVEFPTAGKMKLAFFISGRQGLQSWLDFKQEHQPMRLALVAMLTDHAGELTIGWSQIKTHLLARLATGTGVGRFTLVRTQLAARRTEKPKIGLAPAFHQKHAPILVKAVQQRGNTVRQ